jgi:redox-sensitive bicupin YhaK (pirin superfamily)
MKVKNIHKVVGPMPIRDPIILGAYHRDLYPKGNAKMGPDPDLLKGKQLGNDFDRAADWRMYHGTEIPGFPHHPHRGFEIVTIVEEGFADHFDSKGSKGRYGDGDVQLMSAGAGVLHGEMFPLLNDESPNPFRLFQIWLNLPAKSKMTDPDYKMLWKENIPIATYKNDQGAETKIKVIMGNYHGVQSIAPLKNSWAMDPNHHMGIALISLAPGATFELPAVSPTLSRFVFFYDGNGIVNIEEYKMQERYIADLNGNEKVVITNGDQMAKLLILEGEPIGEPVAAYGPFVMNTEAELQQAFQEYRTTQFGGWPWGSEEKDLVLPKDSGRFASYNFDQVIDKPKD